jgi:hypothetical protein
MKALRFPSQGDLVMQLSHFCIVMRPRWQNGEREPHLYVRLAAVDRGTLWEERWAIERTFVGADFYRFLGLFTGQIEPFYGWCAQEFGAELIDIQDPI